jgi:adenine-specific DNA-methyltransferase
MCNGLNKESIEYIKTTPINYRKNKGQYFTKKSIRDKIWKHLPIDLPYIWEPSAGTGEFIDDLLIKFPKSKITANEIDDKLVDILKAKYKDKVYIVSNDTLTESVKEKYDLVIGNPPYFELKLSEDNNKKFKEILSGRVNIFSLFIKIGLDALKPEGYLAFVVPPSMNNGAYFKALREYIIKCADIISIETFKEDEFSDAQQSVMVIVLKKTKNTGRYVFKRNGIVIFTEEWQSLENEFSSGKTLKELGFSVITGQVVWNQNKKLLSSDSSNTLLIWSHNIFDGEIVLSDKKPQYIKLFDSPIKKLSGPTILVNRIVGSVGKAKIRAAVCNRNEYVAENHVNVIIPQTYKAKNIITQVCNALRSERTSQVAKKITGNVQISKTELQNLIPLYVKNYNEISRNNIQII